MRNHLSLIIFSSVFAIAGQAGATAGVTYHGRLLSPSGQPVASSSVQFKIQVRTPGAENCLLYEEQQTKDLSTAKGVFALNINDGSATVVNTEPFTLDRAFQNRGSFNFGAGKCTGGTVYNPSPTDGRKLVVEFNDGSFSGWEQMPPQMINYVPMAIESMTVGGYNASNLLRVVDGSGAPAVVSPLTQTQHNALLDLANGSGSIVSGQIPAGAVTDAKIDTVSGSKVTGNIAGNAAGFTGSLSGDVTGTQSATTVTKLQGRAVDTAAPTNGQALVWSAGNSRWEPGTIATGASDWSTLTGKPSTFPSDWTTTANIPASFPSDWSTLANKPTSFAPSAHTHSITDITSGVGNYFTYRPNNGACAVGEVLKWEAAGGGRWACGTDISATGGSGVASVSATAPVTVDNTDPNNPRVEIDDATTTTTGVVQLATSSDTGANLVVQANDTRLTNSRAPNGAAGGELTGNYPNPTVVASTTTTNNSLVRRDGSGNISGAAGNFGSLVLNNGGGSTISVQTPAAFTSYVLKLPTGTGTNGQILTSNGADMIWSTPSYMAAVAPGANGNVLVSNGTSWTSAVVPADGTKVSKAGDTMSGSLTLSAGSVIAPANGLAIGTNQLVASGGNVGIGTAAPGDKLTVGAYETPTMTSNQDKTVGVYGAGAAYFRGRDTTNDIEFVMGTSTGGEVLAGSLTNHDLSLRTNNVRRLVVKSTGEIGVGTTAPASLLDIYDATNPVALSIHGSGGNLEKRIDFSSSMGGTRSTFAQIVAYGREGGSPEPYLRFNLSDGSGPSSTPQTRMTIDKDGQVGIGTATPAKKLQIYDGQIGLDGPLGAFSRLDYMIGGTSAWTVGLREDNNYYVYRESAGGNIVMLGANVGIGTASPTKTLDVQGATIGGNVINVTNTSNAGYSTIDFLSSGAAQIGTIGYANTGAASRPNTMTLGTIAARDLILITGNTDRIRVDSSGNVGIGGTAQRKLTVFGQINTQGGLPANPAGQTMCYGTQGGAGDTFGFCSSDRRLKTNIRDLPDDGLETIMAITPSRFDWKSSGAPMVGFIAQDVEKAIPQAVYHQPNTEYLALDTTAIVSYVVKAVQELYAKWSDDHDRIDRLEAENAALKSYLCQRDPGAPFCVSP